MTTSPDAPSPATLALADGTVVRGRALGARGEAGGELCFNTSMTGYQEIITDPSYYGQLMMMTQPHVGNYGASGEAMEAAEPMVEGFIVRDYPRRLTNPQAEETLAQFMKRFGLVGIAGVDTRALVRHVREKGVMNAVISSGERAEQDAGALDEETLVQKAKRWPTMAGRELASKVTTEKPYTFCEGGSEGESPRIVVYDFGVKRHILRSFRERGCTVRVVPAGTDLESVLAWEPDGLFFSNGPGDPRPMTGAVETAREAIETGLPIFGICLGHQLMALAEGLEVYKMHVGHRGANHPVKDLEAGRVEVTTQNHGFAVDMGSVDPSVAEVTHRNLNDGSVEGLRFKEFPGLSLQYHPEASPGPHDSRHHFDRFLELVAERQGASEEAPAKAGAAAETGAAEEAGASAEDAVPSPAPA